MYERKLMMRLGRPSLETTLHALVPSALLTATLLICCRLRGVSKEEKAVILHFCNGLFNFCAVSE